MVNRAGAGAETWRVGVLFSRSGVMEVTETEHFFGTALAIQEINQSGGIRGREIEVVAYDPGSDPETYRKLADRLLTEDGISVIFGCSTSAARKAILPAIERRNGLLWYPSLYEGFEYSPNVIYTGASPNQNSFPLAEYLVRNYGRRVFLVGSDYVYPRESNRIMRDLIVAYGGEIAGELYVPMEASSSQLQAVLKEVREQQPDVLFSTVVGRPAQNLYRLYHDAGFDAAQMPIASLTIAEGEIREIGAEFCAGHITAATYFGSLDSDSNTDLCRQLSSPVRRSEADQHVERRRLCAGSPFRARTGNRRDAGYAASRRRGPRPLISSPGRLDPDRPRKQSYLADATIRQGSP